MAVRIIQPVLGGSETHPDLAAHDTLGLATQAELDAAVIAGGFTQEQIEDMVAALIVAGANISVAYNDATPSLTVSVTGLTESVQDIMGAMASGGNGLTVTYDDTANTWIFAVNTDDSSIEVSSDALRVKAAGITNAMLAGSIALSKLATDPLARANHTGTQLASTVSDFAEAVDDRVGALLVAGAGVTLTYNDASGTLTIEAGGGGYTDEQAQDAVGAILVDTASIDFTYTDATPSIIADIKALGVTNAMLAGSIALSKLATDPLARANHTGSQAASTISDFSEAVDDRVGALLAAGANITLDYNDASNTLTITGTGGGGSSTPGTGACLLMRAGEEVTPAYIDLMPMAFALNKAYYIPIRVDRAFTVVSVGCDVTELYGAGGVLQVGFMSDDDTFNFPGARKATSFGDIVITSTGHKIIAGSQALTAGLHWAVAVVQVDATGTLMAAEYLEIVPSGTVGQANMMKTLTETNVSGDFPANAAPNGAAVLAPLLYFEVS